MCLTSHVLTLARTSVTIIGVRRCWALVVLAACGRVGFDASNTAGDARFDGSPFGIGDSLDMGGSALMTAYVKPSNTETFDTFGAALALSGDGMTLAVGAPQEDSSTIGIETTPDNAAAQSGAVYVFVRIGTTWQQQAYLKPSNTGVSDLFGWSLALSDDGSRLVVGAPQEDSPGVGIDATQVDTAQGMDSGAAYVFTRSGSTWTQQTYVKASNSSQSDDFGVAVAMSSDGTTIAVGAGGEDSSAAGINGNQANDMAPNAGAVYVFTATGNTWAQQAYVKASNTGTGDLFGTAVALSSDGDTLAIGADSEDSASTNQNDETATEAGAVYVFTRTGITWTQQAYVKASAPGFGDFLGKRIGLAADGNTLVCSAAGDDATQSNSGAAYVFTRSGTTWTERAQLKASNVGDNDQFGADVAIAGDGNTVVVGAIFEDDANDALVDSGASYVYLRNGTTWAFERYVKAPAPTAGDLFGNALALSADGGTAAIAAYREDSAATGIDGDATDESAMDAGAVYIIYR